MRNLSRRQFIYASAGLGSAAVLGTSLGHRREAVKRASAAVGGPLVPYARTSQALGSKVSITALHWDGELARLAVDDAFGQLELVEQVMSLYRAESQVSQLNQGGVVENPHPYLIHVLRAASALSKRSSGAFDITIQPLWELFSWADKKGRLPTLVEINAAREQVDWRQVNVTRDRVSLTDSRTAVTLNGIAQGFALDSVLDALRRHGIRHSLVDTGELGAQGQKANGGAWTIGIQHPRHEDAYIALAELDGRCLATSGDYATTFSDDNLHHHLVDPRTGRSPKGLSSVSIMAPTGIEADSLSTAVFVMGAKRGLEFIRSTPQADAFFVHKDGRTTVTEGFPLRA